jgi:NTE family protein
MRIPRGGEYDPTCSTHEPVQQPGQTGRASQIGVTLALSGGFSRGFAHLGVLEVLEKERIPIVAIAGTSIGSLLGAAYADGISIHELLDLGRHVHIRNFARFGRSPQTSPDRDRIGQFIREWLGARRVEELTIPTAIVATDVHTFAPYVFNSGPLEVAVRASCAFPGLFAPVEHHGRLLADGSLAAPVPTEVASQMNGGCVLAVAVSISGNSLLPRKKLGEPVRGTLHTAPSRVSPIWATRADVILEPAVKQIEWDDFTRVQEAHAAGAEAMRAALPCVHELLAKQNRLRASALLHPAGYGLS